VLPVITTPGHSSANQNGRMTHLNAFFSPENKEPPLQEIQETKAISFK
jgi:hypothetical protein